MIRIYCIALFSITFFSSFPQQYSLDSIKKILATDIHDTTRLEAITCILENENQRDSISIHYNKEVIAILAKNLRVKELDFKLKNKYLYYLAYWYADEAVVLASEQSSQKVVSYIEKSAAIFKYLKMELEYWNSIINKGNALRKMADYEGAIACFFEALKHHESSGDELGKASAYGSIGVVFLDQSKYNEAITYFLKALNYYNGLKKPENKDLYEQAIINHNIGVCYLSLTNYKEAKIFFNKALVIEKENNFLNNLSTTYNRLASIAIQEKDFKKAIGFYQEGLVLAKKDRSKALLMNGLGEFYLLKKEYHRALNFFTQALSHATQAKDLEIVENCYLNLYTAYKANRQYDKSLQAFEKYTEFKKINNEEISRNALAQQRLKYDYEKKELEAKVQQEKKIASILLENEKKNTRKNIFLYIFISLAVILGLSAFYIYKFYKQKTIINASKANALKQKLLLSQMNPHFIFNSVDNIQSLIHNNQNKDAVNYLTKFSKLTRQILENSSLDYISLQEEMTMLENYLNIQQLLHNNKFDYSIALNNIPDAETILIPPMLTQPFIENAIKHGLKNKTNHGSVKIRFFLEKEHLFFEVRDNGEGLETKTPNAAHKSMATSIVRERLNNNSPKKSIEINIESIYEGQDKAGVKTLFEIPYIYDR